MTKVPHIWGGLRFSKCELLAGNPVEVELLVGVHCEDLLEIAMFFLVWRLQKKPNQ